MAIIISGSRRFRHSFLSFRFSLVASLLATSSVGWSPQGITTALIPTTKRARLLTTSNMASSASTSPNNDNNNLLDSLGLPSPLLLGSASFTRKLILKEMNIPFHIVVRPIDEKNLGDRTKDPPADLVMTLGKAKAHHLVEEIQAGRCNEDLPKSNNNDNNKQGSFVVLTADQVVTCAGKILEKPESITEAKTMVSQYPTHPPSTVGSCVLTHVPSGIQVSGVDTATVIFSSKGNFDGSKLVDDLLKDDAPILSCAGGLMVEHPLVKAHIERIEGTEDSVMGLSKDLVVRLLQEMKEELTKAKLI